MIQKYLLKKSKNWLIVLNSLLKYDGVIKIMSLSLSTSKVSPKLTSTQLNRVPLLKNTNTFFLFLFILLTYIVPTLRIGPIPIRAEFLLTTLYLCLLLLFFKQNLKFKKFGSIHALSFLLLFLYSFLLVFIDMFKYSVGLKTIFTPFIWIIYFLTIFTFGIIYKNVNYKTVFNFLKFIIWFELILGVLQRFNVFGIKTWGIFEVISANNASYYVDLNSDRVFGTIGNPVWFNFVMYGISKIFHINTRKSYWLILSFCFIALGFSRNIAVFAIVFELISLFLARSFVDFLGRLKRFIAIFIPLLIIFVVIISKNEYLSRIVLSVLNSPHNDYSVNYRMSMFSWLSQSLVNPLFGDIWDVNLPPYIDMGYILTIKRYGIIGAIILYSIFFAPIIFNRIFKDSYQRNSYIFIGLFCLTTEITTVVTTNTLFVGHIVLWVFITEIFHIYRSNMDGNLEVVK